MGTKLPAALCLDMDDTILAFCASADPYWEGLCAHLADRIIGRLKDLIR